MWSNGIQEFCSIPQTNTILTSCLLFHKSTEMKSKTENKKVIVELCKIVFLII